MRPMKTGNWGSRIDDVTEAYKDEFGMLDNRQLNRRPDDHTWSIAQIIDHVIRVNESYYPVFTSVRDGTYKRPLAGRSKLIVSFFGKLILKSVNADRKKKMRAPKIWEPSIHPVDGNILEWFAKHQSGLKEMIENTRDLQGEGLIVSSPVNKNVVYSLETAFEIIVTHEERHLNQAREVYCKLNYP